jgi:glutamine synthetase
MMREFNRFPEPVETCDTVREAQHEHFRTAGVKFLQTHTVDITGAFRSRISPFDLPSSGEAVNGILYCLSHGDGQPVGDAAFDNAMVNAANGYPNIQGIPDPGSLRRHGWRPNTASIITDGYMLDGSPCPVDPRHVLRQADQRLRKLGFAAKVALEYEFGIFHIDEPAMQQGDFRELKPWGHSLLNNNLVRRGDYQEFVTEFMGRMASLDIGVSSFVTEYGYGMYEFALAPKPAVEAADDALRAKMHIQELCAERNLVATFMARFQPPGRESACGAHHHVSLWQDGNPVTAAGPNALSADAQHFLAGLLHRLRETHVLFRPTINSYRRFDRHAWSPQDVSWGHENRTAAIRAITTPSASACRFEHRVAGADVNPYLTIAAILAAGAEGIEGRMALPPAQPGLAPDDSVEPLHATLAAATEDFVASDFCADAFGKFFRDHYAASRRNELTAFETWQSQHITDFEWQRYFTQ